MIAEKLNTSHARSETLVHIIGHMRPVALKGRDPVCLADVIVSIAQYIILRQKAINVLRGRMRQNYNPSVMGDLARADWCFAEIFHRDHLGRNGNPEFQLTFRI